jgi:uncharacterized protein YkwD
VRLLASLSAIAAVLIFAAGMAASHNRPNTSALVAAQIGTGPDFAGFGADAASPTAVTPQPTPRTATPAHSPTAAPKPPATAKPKPATTLVVRTTQQRLINQDRARYGLAPLTWSSCLASVAAYEAAHLAQPGVAFKHYDGVTRDLSCHLGRQVGENIGWYSGGINDTWMNNAFMASAEHRANILGPYRYVATAWAVRSDGTAFIAVEFG